MTEKPVRTTFPYDRFFWRDIFTSSRQKGKPELPPRPPGPKLREPSSHALSNLPGVRVLVALQVWSVRRSTRPGPRGYCRAPAAALTKADRIKTDRRRRLAAAAYDSASNSEQPAAARAGPEPRGRENVGQPVFYFGLDRARDKFGGFYFT